MWVALAPLLARFWKPIASIVGAFLAYRKGKADARRQRHVDDLEAYQRTMREMDNAVDDARRADAREWLRDRQAERKRRGDD